jgi:hypothetical protein
LYLSPTPDGGIYQLSSQFFGPTKITPTGNVEISYLPQDLKYAIKYNKNFNIKEKPLEQLIGGIEPQKTANKNQLRDILSALGLDFNYYN